MFRPMLAVVLSFILFPAWQAAAQPLETMPRFVPSVVSQFDALSLRPDGLAFSIGNSPDPEQCKHYQGVARVNAADGTPYLFVSRSGNEPGGVAAAGCSDSDDPGNLLIVRLESRDRTGERVRSNRLRRDWPYPSLIWASPPDSRDRVVQTISFDGNPWPAYGHPGGMQLVGNVLALAMETPYGSDPENQIFFLNVQNPEAPTLLSSYPLEDPGSEFSAGLVGITPIRTENGECCRYLMIVAGKQGKDVRFYRSLPTDGERSDLTSSALDWEEVGRFSESEIESCLGGIDWHTGLGDAHQMFNFVRQGDLDGPLFLVGGRNTTLLPSGDDMVDLYRIHISPDGIPEPCVITHVRSTHVHSDPYIAGGDSANFAAAAGVYVSPSGELIVYATEYENDGPWELLPGGAPGQQTVRFGEYRHRHVVRDGSPTLRPTVMVDPFVEVDEGSSVSLAGSGKSPLTRAWIQLYEDDDAGSSLPSFVDSDQWVNVDYPDRNATHFEDFEKIPGFDEEAGSWRWFAPPGCTIHANDLSVGESGFPGGDTKHLAGTGSVVVLNDLDSIDFDDDLESVTFDPSCDAYYAAAISVAWDLDGNGSFEASGSPVSFDASTLDGPSTRLVRARGQHPTDTSALGTGAPVTTEIRVRNVAPSITSATLQDFLGNEIGVDVPFTLPGFEVTADVSFTDPGYPDTQTASIDWDDGTIDTSFDLFSDARFGSLGVLQHAHAFSASGSYGVGVAVTDDDGGVATVLLPLEVLSPADALEAVIDAIDALIAGGGSAAELRALQRARDELAGNKGGHANNGAVSKLAEGDLVAAITKIRAALGDLSDAEAAGAGDLSPLRDLLGMAAASIANEALADATAALGTPASADQMELDAIAALIAEGSALLAAGDHDGACVKFRQATGKAADLVA